MINLTEDQAKQFRGAVQYLDGIAHFQYQPVDTYYPCVAFSHEYIADYVLLHLLSVLPKDVADKFRAADVQRDLANPNIVYFKNVVTDYTPEEN